MGHRTSTGGAGYRAAGPEPDRQPLWRLATPLAIPVAVVGVLLLVKPEIVRGTFSSAESMLRVAAVIAAWIVFSWVTRRLIPNPLLRTAVVAVPAAVLLWFTVAPYFQEETVQEPLPAAAEAPEAPAALAADEPAVAAEAATDATPAPAGPVKVSTGRLRGLDGHQGSGEAAVYRQPDGSQLVRLEDFEVSNTPGPVLYLVPGPAQESPGEGIKLGSLRGSQGSQNFAIPAGVDVGPKATVLIWCEPFAVAIAGATQQAV